MITKKKILVFNGWYLPSKRCGGPVTSIRNTVNACCDEFDFYIIALNHDFGDSVKFEGIQEGWNQVGNAKVKYIEDHYYDFSKKRLKKLFEELKPDLIWFSGILHPEIKLATMSLAKKMNISVLFSPRGEVSKDRVTTLKAYKKIPYLFLAKHLGFYKGAWFHATSDDEKAGLIEYIGAPEERISYVRNISVMPEDYRKNYQKKTGVVRLVFVSRIHEVKNIKFAIQILNNISDVEVIYDVYGPIESKEYWDECENLINELPDNIKVNYCGVLTPDEVGSVFAKYDGFLFPTINENYGHVIAESLANGCPLLLSRNTTPWDDLDGIAGHVCELDDIDGFANAIKSIAMLDNKEFNDLSKDTINYYKRKLSDDEAIIGHKKMFNKVLSNKE